MFLIVWEIDAHFFLLSWAFTALPMALYGMELPWAPIAMPRPCHDTAMGNGLLWQWQCPVMVSTWERLTFRGLS